MQVFDPVSLPAKHLVVYLQRPLSNIAPIISAGTLAADGIPLIRCPLQPSQHGHLRSHLPAIADVENMSGVTDDLQVRRNVADEHWQPVAERLKQHDG